jgi:hypothetical protein
MKTRQLFAIALIFVTACGGWAILGHSTEERSINYNKQLNVMVEQLYGQPLLQKAPTFITPPTAAGSPSGEWLMPTQNAVQASIQTDYRKKGLIWYPTYKAGFDGAYTLHNPTPAMQQVGFHFDFPIPGGTYNNFLLTLDDKPLEVNIDTKNGISTTLELPPGTNRTVRIKYDTRGIREWHYKLDEHVNRVQNFKLTVQTDFTNFDYPDGSWSAGVQTVNARGSELVWNTPDLITSQDIGIIIPEKLNPGPLTTRITYFAPVCLLFFFVLVLTIQILYRLRIHPMHYLFVAAGFFAFHLLLSYMADVVNIHIAFWIAACVSVFLVTSYLSAALHGTFPWKIAIAAQFFFLILFSYSFFLKGVTGLTVAIGSVLVLAYLMRVTANLDWHEVFADSEPKTPAPPRPLNPLPPVAEA